MIVRGSTLLSLTTVTLRSMEGAIFDGLNEAQREAVQAVRGPVCILAGAGTGKTTTITRRIAYQVSTRAFSSGEILAVTFTEKAAREMGNRLNALGVRSVRAKTFHAEALAQYRRFTGETPDILGAKGQLLHSIAKRLPPPYRFTALRDLATEIEWAKNRRLTPGRYLDALGDREPPIPADLMHRVFAEYEKRKARANKIDFEDLLELTVRALDDDPRANGLVRARYRAFTVDEYQDVNLLQESLLEAWVGDRPDVCVVGDDYQSIFGFTGATPRYLLSFPDRYPNARVVHLEQNYRSTPEVLALANRLGPALSRTPRSLLSARPSGGPDPALRGFATAADEVSWIVSEIRRLNRVENIPFERIAVLHRINGRSEDFEEALSRAHIPFQVRDGSFLRRPAARTVFAKLRLEADGAVADAVERAVMSAGYDPDDGERTGDEATRQADLGRLLRLAQEFGGTSADAFVKDLRSRFAEDDEGRGVVLLTYHRAKGLEFDAVFLPRVEDKEIPFALAKDAEELAEERRLLYVGITRARRHLTLSWASLREGERRSRPKPSPFLRELMPAEPSPKPVGRALAAKVPAEDDPLFSTLRQWRLRMSREADVPAYVVFDNKTLALIAAAKPSTRAALLAIPGVGKAKLDRYAEDVLQIVKTA
jgi:DNA helicase-2/ATP-dependent DNA helicase PcrA